MVTPRFVSTLAALLALAATGRAQEVELLSFHYPGCGPCREMAPVVARLEGEGVSVRRIDGASEPGLAAQLQVQSYPTFIAAVDRHEVGRIVGATSYDDLRRLVSEARPAINPPATPTFAPTASRSSQQAGDWGAGPPATGRPQPSNPRDSELLARSVRLTVTDPDGRSYGTGTIIDARKGEALVVTCAHLFRGPDGAAIDTNGRLSIELFDASTGAPRVVEQVAGQLISHDFDADVALVAIRPAGVVQTATVLGSPGDLARGATVQSVGCDLGADPTVRSGQVVDLNRYNGPANIEVSGAPIQGRSGGGLFDASGRLVGVCFAADEEADEGLYAGIASVHAQLDRIGLSSLYRDGAAAVAPASQPIAGANQPAPPAGLTPIPREPVLRGQNAVAPPMTSTLTATEQATLGEIASRAGRADVTVVIHREGASQPEVLTLDSASPEFVAALERLGVTR